VELPTKDCNKINQPIVHIDSFTAEMDEHYPITEELVGDVNVILQTLNKQAMPSKRWVPSGHLKEQIKRAYQIELDVKEILSFTIENILTVIEKHASEQTIVISDVGAHKLSIARTYQPKQAGRVIISN